MKNNSTQYKFVLTSFFVAIIFILAFTPIGFIHLGFVKATIIHIPVILGSILLEPRIGALLGGTFGLTSFITNTMTPAILSFVFSPLVPIPNHERQLRPKKVRNELEYQKRLKNHKKNETL